MDLDGEQAERFDAQLETLLTWHRREELPRYVDFLGDALALLDGPVRRQDVNGFADRAERAWYRVRDRAMDELLLLGSELSDEQIDEFIGNLEEKQRKYERKYLRRDDEEYRDDASDSLEENLEDYLGSLEDAQLQRVQEASATLIRADTLWLEERRRWIDMLRVELERTPGWQQRLRGRVTDWESGLDSAASDAYEHNTRVVQEAIAVVVDTRSDEQDERLRRKLVDLKADLEELSRKPGSITASAH